MRQNAHVLFGRTPTGVPAERPRPHRQNDHALLMTCTATEVFNHMNA
ncbi:hypothetical protein ACFSTC_57385 [Nonomuraea ferruginea]